MAGKHRKQSSTARTAARFAVAGAVIASPIALAAPANAADWDALAQCESSGDWSADTGNGFQGGLQFTPSTWAAYGGTQYADNAADATREQQIAVAEKVLEAQGTGAWPGCSAKLDWTSGSTSYSAPQEESASEEAPAEETEQAPATAVNAGGADYTVQAGDTLSKIAEKFGVSFKDVFELNKGVIKDPDLIFPGQQLNMG